MVFDFENFSEWFRHLNREMSEKQNGHCDYGPKKAAVLSLFFFLALPFTFHVLPFKNF